MATLQRAVTASGKILEIPLLAAVQGAAGDPLAFTVLDVANRLTACRAAVTSWIAERAYGSFMAAWPVTERR